MENKETILSVDAALGPCSVAIACGDEILAFLQVEEGQKSACELVPMIGRALETAGLRYADIDGIVSTVGPGTFTGLRIGLAAARGTGFAAKKPVYGITTLAAAAILAPQKALILLNAGKGDVYFQAFDAMSPLDEPGLAKPEEAKSMAPKGFVAEENLRPGAREAALVAALHPHLLLPPEPFYVRPPDCKPMRPAV